MPSSRPLDRLLEGNKRYVSFESEHPNRSRERLLETAKEQNPFALIVGCSDSRVAAEILFDQGIGDLFIVRVAGNVVGPIELASIRFAVEQLGVSLIFVLGHENCGAVQAVFSGQGDLIKPISDHIEINEAKTLEDAVKNNILHVRDDLKGQFPSVDVQGGYYCLHTGEVSCL